MARLVVVTISQLYLSDIMSSTVARTVDRPIGRYAPPDWHARNSKLSEVTAGFNVSVFIHLLMTELFEQLDTNAGRSEHPGLQPLSQTGGQAAED